MTRSDQIKCVTLALCIAFAIGQTALGAIDLMADQAVLRLHETPVRAGE